ncbi:hypothetical protein Nepgr_015738 [Nepenthes gracilis]|uniref:Uncharacterized protein n=1 Tax=Nepenthes gracilis TaxID=150966 RepID=A0AAD3SMK9_NEPGR|nr:hypothetical protein Nepgr_015738 [Nepenthes gracilis]
MELRNSPLLAQHAKSPGPAEEVVTERWSRSSHLGPQSDAVSSSPTTVSISTRLFSGNVQSNQAPSVVNGPKNVIGNPSVTISLSALFKAIRNPILPPEDVHEPPHGRDSSNPVSVPAEVELTPSASRTSLLGSPSRPLSRLPALGTGVPLIVGSLPVTLTWILKVFLRTGFMPVLLAIDYLSHPEIRRWSPLS